MLYRTLIHNARIYTQASGLVADSMVFNRNRIIAVGNNLNYDPDFRNYTRLDLKGRTVIPGFVDAHTHFHYFARSLGQVNLDGLDSLDSCLKKIKRYAANLRKGEWLIGDGYAPDRFRNCEYPDRYLLDKVSRDHPAFLFSKDQHSAWVNSKALELANITKATTDPKGGKIDRDSEGIPTGILREQPAYGPVYNIVPALSKKKCDQLFLKAMQYAYKKGVTAVHSFDDSQVVFECFVRLAEKGNLGLKINYYFPSRQLPYLLKTNIRYGTSTDFLRIAGVKLFADGSLGSRTALCFNRYIGSKSDYGIETTSIAAMKRIIKSASKLGLPCAIHAIGDKAIANVLDAFESTTPLRSGGRHRIEHLQMIRRKDISRLKKLGITASMQPSHCISDIDVVRRFWGKRGANAYIFRTLLDRGIPLAFGSDVPIEPLDPIYGIAAAIRRARTDKRDVFYPDQRISAEEALFGFTAGAAYAVSQEHCQGYLLPGYPADFVILSQDICRIAPSKILDTEVLATVLDGKLKYSHSSLNI